MMKASATSKAIPIVIPYFRDPASLEKCIASIKAQTGIETEIFVRDNSDDNILYTRAVNEGLRKFCFADDYDYTLILTQDAFLRPGCLSKLVSALDSNNSYGIASPVQVDTEDRITWAGSLEAFPWGRHALQLNDLKNPYPTYWANGACFLLRNSMVRDIGVMDHNMQFIFSDADYSFTARSRDWDVIVVPEAVCEHWLKSSANANVNLRIEEVKLCDQLYFIYKWIDGSLYRHLALEGSTISSDNILKNVNESREILNHIVTRLKDSDAARFTHKIQTGS